MRIPILIALAAVGCGTKSRTQPEAPPAPPAVVIAATLPKVAVAAALAAPDVALPVAVVMLDERGALRIAAPPTTWTAPLAKDPADARPIDVQYLWQIAGELRIGRSLESVLRQPPLEEVAAAPPSFDDDEPPPEDDSDEGEGTGTAMMLDEGKMGAKDSDRAAGQYKMKRTGDIEALAREQTIAHEQAGEAQRRTDVVASVAGDGAADEVALPARLIHAVGWINDGSAAATAEPQVLVVAHPAASARALADVLDAARGRLAVEHDGAVRVLRLDFARRLDVDEVPVDPDAPWLEVRVDARGLAFEGVPEAPTAVAWPVGGALDAAAVATAWQDVRARRGLAERTDVDVLVTADTDAQRLIDVLVALDAAGARSIGLGATPEDGSPEAGARGRRIARLRFGHVQAVGDLDKALIRSTVTAARAKLVGCHEQALAIDPAIAGMVATQLFITPNGKVATAAASGVTPALAECVRATLKGLTFPKPKGGGGVQVNYPLHVSH